MLGWNTRLARFLHKVRTTSGALHCVSLRCLPASERLLRDASALRLLMDEKLSLMDETLSSVLVTDFARSEMVSPRVSRP